jgi:hypothetical protein
MITTLLTEQIACTASRGGGGGRIERAAERIFQTKNLIFCGHQILNQMKGI